MSEPDVMRTEIREQPEAAARLLAADEARQAGALLRERQPRLVRFVAHGSSDNAGVYGSYAVGALLGLRTVRPSLSSLLAYRSAEPFDDDFVIALSQSGETSDVVAYAQRARERGAFVLALTNDAASSLAATADFTVPLLAGVEQAIPATKTYMNALLAVALVVAHAHGDPELCARLEQIPELLQAQVEQSEPAVREAAGSLVDTSRLVLLGRGYELATAREVSLKLKEAAGVAAEPLSALEALHGPLAELVPDATVVAFCSRGPLLEELKDVCRVVHEYGARVIAIGNGADAVGADLALPVADLPEVLAPMLSVVPGQLLAYHLATCKHADSARPRGLSKIVAVRPAYIGPGEAVA